MENPRETLITQQDLQDLRSFFLLLFTHRNLVMTASLYNSIGDSTPVKKNKKEKEKKNTFYSGFYRFGQHSFKIILSSPLLNSTRCFCGGAQWWMDVQGGWGGGLWLCPATTAACALFPWQLCDRLRGGALPVQRPGVVGAAARRAGQGAEHRHHRVCRRAGPAAAAAGPPGCLLPQVLLPDTAKTWDNPQLMGIPGLLLFSNWICEQYRKFWHVPRPQSSCWC